LDVTKDQSSVQGFNIALVNAVSQEVLKAFKGKQTANVDSSSSFVGNFVVASSFKDFGDKTALHSIGDTRASNHLPSKLSPFANKRQIRDMPLSSKLILRDVLYVKDSVQSFISQQAPQFY